MHKVSKMFWFMKKVILKIQMCWRILPKLLTKFGIGILIQVKKSSKIACVLLPISQKKIFVKMFPFHLKIAVITMAEAVMAMKHSATSVQKSGKNGNGYKQPRYMQNIQVLKKFTWNWTLFFFKITIFSLFSIFWTACTPQEFQVECW